MNNSKSISKEVRKLQNIFSDHSNLESAESMRTYMNGLFPFWGIKTPLRRKLTKDFVKTATKSKNLPDKTLIELWERSERECQYVALDIAIACYDRLSFEHLPLIEYLITTKSWWDTVDVVATKLVGEVFYRFPDVRSDWLTKWLTSENIWLHRTCIIFQLKYKEETDWATLIKAIENCLHSKEFFIQKAIGWALREFAKQDPSKVMAYTKETELPWLSRYEALRGLSKS